MITESFLALELAIMYEKLDVKRLSIKNMR